MPVASGANSWRWITETKQPQTRERRIAQAIAWIAEGKQRNWKYQNCE
jgi:uncharacterized protein YdeI (YjbR/CyaY-like superfamily)